jgi:hypothetical protein
MLCKNQKPSKDFSLSEKVECPLFGPRIDGLRLHGGNLGGLRNASALRHQENSLDAPVGSDIPHIMKGPAEPESIMWIESTFGRILRSSHEPQYERKTIPVRICGYLLS